MGFRVWGLGFGALKGLGCRVGVQDLGFRVWGFEGFRVWGFGSGVLRVLRSFLCSSFLCGFLASLLPSFMPLLVCCLLGTLRFRV